MKQNRKNGLCAVAAGALLMTTTSVALACGTPPPNNPPPPPSAPPIVCCTIIRVVNHADGTRWVTIRYSRKDGVPMFVSNPMTLSPGQSCICAFDGLPPLPGVQIMGMSFSFDANCDGLPPNVPGFGPFEPEPDPNVGVQVDQFFQTYYLAAGMPPPPAPRNVFRFGPTALPLGPTVIPAGAVFDVFVTVQIPGTMDPAQLVVPGWEGGIALFFNDNGLVFLEPGAPGAPPITTSQFAANPSQPAAFYKFAEYPLIIPVNCCPLSTCPADLTGDGVVNAADLAALLGSWGLCL